MLNRLRQPVGGQLETHLRDRRHGSAQASQFVAWEPSQLIQQLLVLRRQRGEPKIWRAERDQVLGGVRQVELHPAVERQDVQPARQRMLALDQLPQLGAGVAHQHPTSFHVAPEERWNAVRPSPGEQRDERSLVTLDTAVRLEVDVTDFRRDAQHRRPRLYRRLLDLAGHSRVESDQLRLDPRVRLRRPRRIHPARHRPDPS